MVLAACLFFFSLGEEKSPLLASLDNRGVDAMFRWRGGTPTTGEVVIVDIDEKSLLQLGQWPWPRDTVARLVDQLRAGGVKVIGFDVVFAEEDRTSPSRFLDDLASQFPKAVVTKELERVRGAEALDHDQVLGSAVASLPSVLGYVFLLNDDGFKDPAAVPFPSMNIRTSPEGIPFDQLSLIPAYRAIINVPGVARATSEGFFNFFPDESGMVSKVPLFLTLDGIPYPSLALEMLRIGIQEEAATIQVSRLQKGERQGVLGVSVGSHFIATDDYGQMTINHRGGIGAFPYVSAVDIIEGRSLEKLRGKYVLLGTTAAGLLDLRSTPFSNVFPGVEIHATIIDNILSGDPLTHDPITERGITLVLIIVGGLLLSALLAYGTPLAGAVGALLMVVLSLAGNYEFFFLNNQVVGLTYPLLVLLAVFMVVNTCNYFFEGREKRFIDKAFGRYVSPQVVQQLKKNPGQLSLSGEEKELTVMFSDIRGFTTISEQLTATQLGRFMNRYLTAMSAIILTYKGTVDKFIGDAIMAIWGAPLDDAEHPLNAVRTALAMQVQFRELVPQWEQEGFPPFAIGIGINSGPVSVGNFGSDERFDYTVIGDNVNLASRLEGLTKEYGVMVIISEQTLAGLEGKVYCRLLDRVRVKGKLKPVKIYEPLVEGEPPLSVRQAVDDWQAALDRYRQRDFATAIALVTALHEQDPQPLYRLYLERMTTYLAHPPADDWDGVFTLTHK